jgi:hypothetical protein
LQPAKRAVWHSVCIIGRRSPRGQIKSEGENENEKDSSKKGIEAEQREAVDGQCWQAVGYRSSEKAVIEPLPDPPVSLD